MRAEEALRIARWANRPEALDAVLVAIRTRAEGGHFNLNLSNQPPRLAEILAEMGYDILNVRPGTGGTQSFTVNWS